VGKRVLPGHVEQEGHSNHIKKSMPYSESEPNSYIFEKQESATKGKK
jgi:hypothetical protein